MIEQMRFLGGLLHDAGKAQAQWQVYIREKDEKRRRELKVLHAFLGSMLFAMYSLYLLDTAKLKGKERRRCLLELMWIARDIADHHTNLGNLDREAPWWYSWRYEALQTSDVVGLDTLVRRSLPADYPLWMSDADRVEKHEKELRAKWEKLAILELGSTLREGQRSPKAMSPHCVRSRTGKLIAADRFHSAGLSRVSLSSLGAETALETLLRLCADKQKRARTRGQASIAKKRESVQQTAYALYLEHPNETFYSLNVPTGLGKTLTALRVALDSVRIGGARRIVYVAPYLAILSQAAGDVREATGLEVLEHHHLAASTQAELDELGFLAMESWQSPIVATTFNQLFRALFPKRAQHTLRLPALEDAFVIVDEPQILDHKVWNLFLTSLETMARLNHMQCLFVTATLPTTDEGLEAPPIPLSKQMNIESRYTVEVAEGSWSETVVAQKAISALPEYPQVAVIMNTIADVANVYEKFRSTFSQEVRGMKVLSVHGLMHPAHKARQLDRIRQALAKREPIIAVGTQVLEAGVNLSFRAVFRARPLAPSVLQAAGRANRHAEERTARVIVFDFERETSGIDSRIYVYRDGDQRGVTDEMLFPNAVFSEAELSAMITEYYEETFSRNPHTAAYKKLAQAAAGNWSELAGIEPFGPDYERYPVFVPVGLDWLDEAGLILMKTFDISTLEELYDKYADFRWKASLDFIQRKRFMGLLQNFVVSVPYKLLDLLPVSHADENIAYCTKPDLYNLETGFGNLLASTGLASEEALDTL